MIDYAAAMDRLRAAFGGRCVDCRSRANLEFSHVKPTRVEGRGRGRARRYHDIKNHPDCYALRCRPCHRLYDLKNQPWISPEHIAEEGAQ